MCGILGIYPADHKTLDSARLLRADAQLRHRGPDDLGFLLLSGDTVKLGREWDSREPVSGIAMLHRRLSILDLSETGRQPMQDADGRYFIIFNGEIYNYLELRRELESLGCSFRSRSDTEVLLTAYSRWGVAAFSRLVGMFAFAILDTQQRKLVLARDFFGIKPLYYTLSPEGFAFASEIKALLELQWTTRRVNPERLYLYLRYGITDHGSETLFSDIHQLAPGHCLELSLDNPRDARTTRYWVLDEGCCKGISFEAAAEQLRELFLDSIRLHLRSDVTVGAALSGGIDSSSIVMAARHVQGRDFPINTFSYIAEGAGLSEERWINVVGNAAGVTAHRVRVSPQDLADDLEHLIACQEEPFGSTTIYAQYRVFQLAREAGIKVVLSGQGADELLAGYRPYLGARLASLVRHRDWGAAWRFLFQSGRLPGVTSRSTIMEAANFLMPPRLQAPLRSVVGKEFSPSWLNSAWFRERGVTPAPVSYTAEKDVLHQSLKRDFFELGLPHLLRYEDRNSMAFSIESRVPFLTPALANFVFSLPEEYLVAADGTSKAVFRRAMKGIVPEEILQRKDKIGFATPEGQWLSALLPWVERTLRSDLTARIPIFRARELDREWQRARRGKASGSKLWRILNLAAWAKQFDARFD
jgi:asparagine synthase (glutamine-hydrolysing)